MMTTCFLQSSVVSTPLRFPPSIANRRRNLSPTSPVLIHNLYFHHFSSSKLNYFAYFTSSCCRNCQHLFVSSSDGINLTKSCDSEKDDFSRNDASSSEVVSNNGGGVNSQDEIGEMRILVLLMGFFGTIKEGFEKVMLDHLIAEADPKVPLLAELNKEENFIQRFEQRDPNHEISLKLQSTTMDANSTFIRSQKLKMDKFPLNSSNFVILAAALTVGVTVFLLDQKAMALGPEGPLMEEFWENMRRYALYALTVSTGVVYAVFQPLYELLRNPISAILIITIAAGSFYLVSQVLSAMVGVSDFTYDYSY